MAPETTAVPATEAPAPIPDGRVRVGADEYLPDAKGKLVPVSLIKPARSVTSLRSCAHGRPSLRRICGSEDTR